MPKPRLSDTLPDGRVDHRGHESDDQGTYNDWCLTCAEDEEDFVWWSIPYGDDGRPIPRNWRELPIEEVRKLCGMYGFVSAGLPGLTAPVDDC